MAATDRWVASITLIDGVLRESVVSYYVAAADAQDYLAAAPGGARDATLIGVLFARTLGISDCAEVRQSVGLEQIQDTITNPADTVLRGNKLKFSYRAGASNYSFTIPGREAAGFTQAADSLNVSLTGPTAMTNFITAFEAVAKSIYGATPDITKIVIVD